MLQIWSRSPLQISLLLLYLHLTLASGRPQRLVPLKMRGTVWGCKSMALHLHMGHPCRLQTPEDHAGDHIIAGLPSFLILLPPPPSGVCQRAPCPRLVSREPELRPNHSCPTPGQMRAECQGSAERMNVFL